MTAILEALLSYVLLYKYVALFGIFFLSSVGIPLPTVPVLIAGAVFGAEGYLNLGAIFAVATLGSVSGDMILYWVALKVGERIVDHHLFKHHFSHFNRERIIQGIHKHPFLIIVGSRLVGLTTIVINLVLGILKFSWKQFLLFDVIGEAASTALYMTIGYYLGNDWEYITPYLERIVVVVFIIFVVVVGWQARKMHQRRHDTLEL